MKTRDPAAATIKADSLKGSAFLLPPTRIMQKDIFTVYVLYSNSYDKIYIGSTSNLIQRFHSHNSLSKKGWTKNFRPWFVIYCEYFNSKSHGMVREKQLKSYQGRKWMKDNIENWKH